MRARTARHARFGVLAARHAWERERLTPWQVDTLENGGTRSRVAAEAYRREEHHARARAQVRRFHGWLV